VQILVVVGLVLCVAATAGIIYKLNESNHISGNVGEQTIRLTVTLSANATSLTEGDKVQLTAEVTQPNSVNSVTFKDGSITLTTTSFTNAGSVWRATYTYTPAVGSHDWYTANEP
jgi:hypothetical protein